MSEEDLKRSNSNNARRKLLKGLAVGGGAVIAGKSLPESWSRPVVDAVMLPAHAQTSFGSFTGQSRASIETDSRFARLLEGLVQKAHAGNGIPMEPMLSAISCIRENADGTVVVDAVLNDGYLTQKLNAASVTVGGAPSSMTGSPCGGGMGALLNDSGLISDANAQLIPVDVQVDSINGSAVGRYLIDGGPTSLEFNLPLGSCTPPPCPTPA